MEKRIQLTLFVPEFDAREIELIREKYNPVQFALIAAHVTLCREDELLHLDQVLANLQQLKSEKIRIFFGPPRRFSEGKGVMIPAAPDNKSFHELRAKILAGILETPRIQEPHITLMHPRNSTCTDEIFEAILQYPLPNEITFSGISLIEQEMGKEWRVLDRVDWF